MREKTLLYIVCPRGSHKKDPLAPIEFWYKPKSSRMGRGEVAKDVGGPTWDKFMKSVGVKKQPSSKKVKSPPEPKKETPPPKSEPETKEAVVDEPPAAPAPAAPATVEETPPPEPAAAEEEPPS